jgi:8-oxo-dGTP pyrophosphatase MutT (NUDIX family)
MSASPAPRELFSCILSSIPTHREAALTIEQIVQRAGQNSAFEPAFLQGAVVTVLGFLDTLGALRYDGERVQFEAQAQVYTARSLAWFATNGVRLVDGWRDDPVRLSDPISRDEIFDHGLHLLEALEARRERAAAQHGLEAAPVRDQSAVVIVIRSEINGRLFLLHQFDQRANQYQLIGGRMEPGESVLDTAHRELIEELGPSQPQPLGSGDYTLHPLFDGAPALTVDERSRTYGARTRYNFFVCEATFHTRLLLGRHDRWIEKTELLRGLTSDGFQVGNPQLIAVIAPLLAGLRPPTS